MSEAVHYPERRVIGLMSGTSLDGMDRVLVRFFPVDGPAPGWELLDHATRPWPEDLRARLERTAEGEAIPAAEYAALHFEVAECFAEFVLDGRYENPSPDLAAFPGQTLHHAPDRGYGLQVGNASVFATLTGIPTIGDFRSPDLALGGQGAPLVPLADALLRRHPGQFRAIVNLGGIANLTLLPPGEGIEGVRAWDTGPGNLLMDRVARLLLDVPFDRDGQAAARGRVDGKHLAAWLEHPYFALSPPKSTGRETFGRAFLDDASLRRLAGEIGSESLLATLLELTCESLARDLEESGCEVIYLAGGGARNLRLRSRLSERLPSMRVEDIETLSCPGQAREALDFAFLAYLASLGRPVSMSRVTGARVDAFAGSLSPVQPFQE